MVHKWATTFLFLPIDLPAYIKWLCSKNKPEGDKRIQNDNKLNAKSQFSKKHVI